MWVWASGLGLAALACSTSVSGWLWVLCVFVVAAVLLALVWRLWARSVTRAHAGHWDAESMIRSHDGDERKLKVAVIGSGISGIGAMKVCLEEGLDPTCFDADTTYGGFWRYKEDDTHPSVYRCCHIDTDRDLAGYADHVWDPDNVGLLIDGHMITDYVHENAEKFGLRSRTRFLTRVDLVTPSTQGPDPGSGEARWDVHWSKVTEAGAATGEKGVELFDAIMVCSGRHGGGAYVPGFEGLATTKVKVMHSSKYKYPGKHGLRGKTVVVVGVGNSGLDISMDVCQEGEAADTIVVSRSGVWAHKPGHAENAFALAVGETLAIETFFRLPWFFISEIWERVGIFSNQDMKKDQAILNKHGLEPKHRFFQQHYGIFTSLHEPTGRSLHSELEAGRVRVKKGIERFTEHGVVFSGDSEETKVDCVIMATGFKQHCDFVDPKVVDLRWQREGNDVPLWLGCFPINEYGRRICFVNFIQSLTFMAADLQPRLACQVFTGKVTPPPLKEQDDYMRKLRNTMCVQHMDKQYLRVQYGGVYNYYKTLSTWAGCYPSLPKLLRERPTAIWHAWFTTWSPSQYRLVGPGRLESAERSVERMHHSRFWGINKLTGERKAGPYNRGRSPLAWFYAVRNICLPFILVAVAKVLGYSVSDEITDHYDDYVAYAKKHDGHLPHAEFGADPVDIRTNKHGKGTSVWNRHA